MMNAIIMPSQQVNNNNNYTYEEVAKDLGCGYFEKYTLVNGKKDGLYQYFVHNELTISIEYKNGKKYGKYITYYTRDLYHLIKHIEEYKNDIMDGYMKQYDMFGKPRYIAKYENDIIKASVCFNDDMTIDNEHSIINDENEKQYLIDILFQDINMNECIERKEHYDAYMQEMENQLYM